MQFFKRILKEPAPEVAQEEERRSGQRYAINPAFPLKAVISFIGRDEEGQPLSASRAGWDWKGSLLNMSDKGARMHLASSMGVAKGDACDLRLSLEGFDLEVPCYVANIRQQKDGAYLGLIHEITDAKTASAYRQLLEIVALGATLKQHIKKTKPDASGYLVEQYASGSQSYLNVWRYHADKAVAAFEFVLKDCLVRAAEGHRVEYLIGTDAAAASKATGTKSLEIHRLFHWVVANLAPAVPVDVREHLKKYAI